MIVCPTSFFFLHLNYYQNLKFFSYNNQNEGHNHSFFFLSLSFSCSFLSFIFRLDYFHSLSCSCNEGRREETKGHWKSLHLFSIPLSLLFSPFLLSTSSISNFFSISAFTFSLSPSPIKKLRKGKSWQVRCLCGQGGEVSVLQVFFLLVKLATFLSISMKNFSQEKERKTMMGWKELCNKRERERMKFVCLY